MHKATVPSDTTSSTHDRDARVVADFAAGRFGNDSVPRTALRFRPFEALAETWQKLPGQRDV